MNLMRHRTRQGSRRRRLAIQNLDRRELLAADAGFPAEALPAEALPVGTEQIAEAESMMAPDLVQFAKDLAASGAKLYGAAWGPFTTQQMQLFEDGGNELPFIEVTLPDRSISDLGIDNQINAYPTWVFPDGTRNIGSLSLEEISELSDVPIPLGMTPLFEPLGEQTVRIGSPLHLPIDAYDPNGEALTVTVSVDDPDLVEARVLSGNRSIRIDMETYGDMVFELFEQRAPIASGRMIQLAEAGFYDDIVIHRVIDDFVIQGGDPTGTGAGGSNLPNFDDDYHEELQHNRKGVISFAKAADDTNNSQFFVPESPLRYLDFNFSVFGQLIEGEEVREAISEHATNSSDRPQTDIKIKTIDVFRDMENSLVMLKPTGNGTGSTEVTITVTDESGNSFSETVAVDIVQDDANSQPFLNPIEIQDQYVNTRDAVIQVSSTDIEGDAVEYSALVPFGPSVASATISDAGTLRVTPAPGFVGSVDVRVSVRPGPGVSGNSNSDIDNQVVTLDFVQPMSFPTIITADRMHQLHTIPANDQHTAIVFRATADATISVHPIGTVSLSENVSILDDETHSISRFENSIASAEVQSGRLYAIVFEPNSSNRLYSVRSTAGDSGFSTEILSNLFEPTDVNLDGQTSPRDVLAVINGLSQASIAEGEHSVSNPFLDANGDGRITPRDALSIVNHLMLQRAEAERDSIDQFVTSDFLRPQSDDDERDQLFHEMGDVSV